MSCMSSRSRNKPLREHFPLNAHMVRPCISTNCLKWDRKDIRRIFINLITFFNIHFVVVWFTSSFSSIDVCISTAASSYLACWRKLRSVRGTSSASASAPATSALFRNAFGRMTSYATHSRPASAPDRMMSRDVAWCRKTHCPDPTRHLFRPAFRLWHVDTTRMLYLTRIS